MLVGAEEDGGDLTDQQTRLQAANNTATISQKVSGT